MDTLLKRLRSRYPEIRFKAGEAFCWSPRTQEVIYNEQQGDKRAQWALLHETGHAVQHHQNYALDFELVLLEISAWEEARRIAEELNIEIDDGHIQDCLDTYRDWLYARSMCPSCGTKSIQQSDVRHYLCFNCRASWKVAPSRFCRAYRMVDAPTRQKPLEFDRVIP